MTVQQRPITALDERIAGQPDGPWYQRREVAALIGVTPSAVAAAIERHPELASSRMAVRWRGQVIRIYSGDDLKALHAYFTRESKGSGRPRIWTAAESVERRRVRDQVRHHTERAERLHAAGEKDRAHEAAAKARTLQLALDAQLDRRMASRVAAK